MNEFLLPVILLGVGAFFSLVTAVLAGLLLHALRGQRDRFAALEDKISKIDAKINEARESVARLEGNRGILGTHQNWRE